MAIVQISKIQVRTGAHSDLPQLDIGELGFATDTKTVHIGNDTVLYPPDPNNPEPSNTRLLTDSPDCVINASQIRGVITLPVTDTKITGGTNGQYLQTDGTGNLTWSTVSGGGGGGSPGGSTTQIQFNDAGSFGGDSKLTFNKSTGLLSITGNITATNITGTLLTSIQPSITSVGTLANLTIAANGNINLGGELKITNNNLHGGSDYAGMITLTTTVSGASNTSKFIRLNKTGGLEILNSDYSSTIFTLTDEGNISVPYYIGSGRFLTEVNATTVDTLHSLTVDGTVNFSGASNVSLGSIGSIHITGGTNGQVLKTDGSGGLSWTTITANGNSVPSYGNSDVDLRIASYTGNVAKALYAYAVDGVNVNGTVSLATTATTAGTVTTSAQPNITSVGTLTSLTVTGNVSSSILNATGNISGLRFYGNAIGLTNIPAGNIVGYVTNATNANYATTAGSATIVPWTGISSKPTTISGYGITDIYGPLLMATNSVAQTITTTGFTTLIYSNEVTDIGSYYNTTTGRYTPQVAGYYQITATVLPTPTGSSYGAFFLAIYKNTIGIAEGNGSSLDPSWGESGVSSATTLVYLNGSTDYIQCKLYCSSITGTFTTTTGVPAYFQASWIRP